MPHVKSPRSARASPISLRSVALRGRFIVVGCIAAGPGCDSGRPIASAACCRVLWCARERFRGVWCVSIVGFYPQTQVGTPLTTFSVLFLNQGFTKKAFAQWANGMPALLGGE